jgi:hypothetical protein
MTSYHRPEKSVIQELKDISHRLRIHSIHATEASKSGYVKEIIIICCLYVDYFTKIQVNEMFF